MRPLGKGLEVIDRFAGFHFDDALHLPAAIGRLEHDIRIQRRGRVAYRRALLSSGVDAHFVLATKLRLQLPDDAVMLQLLPDWPDRDWAHRIPPNRLLS